MNTRHDWRAIDPTEFNEGVLYLPEMVEIQPKEPDWGLPNMAEVLARVDEDRPHGRDEANGKILCLRCMAINVHADKEPSPVWMYFQERNGLRLFCHSGSGRVHAEHMPESDKHKALVEREVRTCESVGASVDTEVRTAAGRRRADFIAIGSEVTLAGEVQLAKVSRPSIGQRQRDLTRHGNRVLWTTDSTRPDFLDRVPRLIIPALSGWQQALRDSELAIVAGWWLVEYQRCGWADAWTGVQRCPRTGSPRPCGKVHAYPTRNVDTSKGRPHLDLLVGGIVMSEWLPYKRNVRNGHQFEWIPAKDYERVVEDRGGDDPGKAEQIAGKAGLTAASAKRTCEAGTDGRRIEATTDVRLFGGSDSEQQVRTKNESNLNDWADHPRWVAAPRCTICRQPLMSQASISLGVCARHRLSREA